MVKLILLFAIMLGLHPANAQQSENPDTQVKECRSSLKSCQNLVSSITGDIKRTGWDHKKNEFPLDVLSTIRNKYFSYFSCQYEYKACLTGESANLNVFQDLITKTPEAEWEESTPEREGVSTEIIEKAVQSAEILEDLRSLLIVKNGKLISESYFQFKEDLRPQWMMSATKSIVSLLIGIAIDEGFISSENDNIRPYLKEYFSSAEDSLKGDIKIVDLLTMKSGLDFTDKKNWWENNAGTDLNDYWFADNAKDYALKDDLIYKPGEKYQYSTISIDMLTTIIKESSGMNVDAFADRYLFGPLGIVNYQWAHDTKEYHRGGHVLFLRPRGFAKIGQLVLDEGTHNSEVIVSQEWLKKTFTPHQTKDVWEGNFSRSGLNLTYGYLWYISEIEGYQIRFAFGYGGQLIVLIPEKNMLVATTANPDVIPEKGFATPDKIFDVIVRVLLKDN